jgi:hypothetical protein
LKRLEGKQVRPEDLKITVTYWGPGKGRWKPRSFTAEELPAAEYAEAWGERTGDLYLNDDAYFANVPELVWTYQLGGYPVLKKWLGYRQADRREGQPFTDDERRWFRQIIQRIAAADARAFARCPIPRSCCQCLYRRGTSNLAITHRELT